MNEERLRRSPNVGIIGSSSLLGKELKDLIEESGFPLGRLILLETEEYAGLLQEFAADIQVTQIISPESLEDVDIAFFACGPEIMQAYIASGAKFPDLTIDLTQSGPDGKLFLSGLSDPSTLEPRGYFTNPHPAAIVIARLLHRLHNVFGIQSTAVTALEPASERGNAGVDELQQQTVSLLNFQNIEYKTFGGQISFNILPGRRRDHVEERIMSQVAELMEGRSVTPMVRTLHSAVFHSLGFSIFMQLSRTATRSEIASALAADGAFVLHDDDSGPSPVGVVGSHGIHVGRIEVYESPFSSASLWLAADNLRIAASSAIRTAENIMLATIGR